jgi:hypothetical protein
VDLTEEISLAILTNKNWLKPSQKPVQTNTKTPKSNAQTKTPNEAICKKRPPMEIG